MARFLASFVASGLAILVLSPTGSAAEFRSDWPVDAGRDWVGRNYWANPLQDWRLRNGLLECHVAGGDRNVFLLTREIDARSGDLDVSVTLGRLAGDTGPLGIGIWAVLLPFAGAWMTGMPVRKKSDQPA